MMVLLLLLFIWLGVASPVAHAVEAPEVSVARRLGLEVLKPLLF